MLPRRHVLDVWMFTRDKEKILPMSAGTLAIDAIKYLNSDPEKDHLEEALDFNEFICYMHPSIRPHNRSLLLHVISDLLGLLLYGAPDKRRASIESLEIIDYSNANISFPVLNVWNYLKDRVKSNNVNDQTIIKGFVDKIRIETDILHHYPFIDDIFAASCSLLEKWLPALSDFYRVEGGEIRSAYARWCEPWLVKNDANAVLDSMVERLAVQAERDFGIAIDKKEILTSIASEPQTNKRYNDVFSKWYVRGVNLLFRI